MNEITHRSFSKGWTQYRLCKKTEGNARGIYVWVEDQPPVSVSAFPIGEDGEPQHGFEDTKVYFTNIPQPACSGCPANIDASEVELLPETCANIRIITFNQFMRDRYNKEAVLKQAE